MLAPLVGSTNTDYSGKLDWFRHPPFFFSYHLLAMLNTPVHLPLTADVLLEEASISEVSKKILAP